MKRGDLKTDIKDIAKEFLERTIGREIYVISHFDTDGISSATIMIKTLKKLDKKFSLKIVKSLDEQFIKNLPKGRIIVFLDLASGSFNHLKETSLNMEEIFIIDHHEVIQKIPEGIHIINPELNKKEKISSSGLTYLFCRELDSSNKELAKLAVLGMIGDCMEKGIDRLNNGILENGEIIKKRGLLIYPSTRPLNRTLEYCSHPYILGVTGDVKGVLELLRETGITQKNGRYPSITELTEEEMSKLVTAIMLRNPKAKNEEIIGDIFLIKMYNKLEDARELSAMVNACSRLGRTDAAMQFCMEIPKAKKDAEEIHIKYKQHLISALKFISETDKIEGKGFVIINAGENVKDTMIGTIASILSSSALYEEGTIITTMALDKGKEKIKVSSRNAGRNGRNVREILNYVIEKIGGEVGGHEFAAGCLIEKDKEDLFIDSLKKSLEIEMVKI